MSHSAVYSEVLFWFVVVLTLLLLALVGVVVRTPRGTVGPRQPAELNPPPPPQPVRWPQAAGFADAAIRSAQTTAASTASGVRAGAHRRARRQGAHRAGISTGHARSAAGRTGRHRAGVH